MDDEIIMYFKKALETIEDSKIAIDNKRYNMSANRSYYAIFYAAKALLLKNDLNPKTHSGVIQEFGLEYVVNNAFNPKIAKFFSNLEDFRENADYDVYFSVTEVQAEENLNNAILFIEESKKFL